MAWFSSKKPDAQAAKQMGELGAAVYLNKALGGTGSRKALQKIVNSNSELKETINSTPGWEKAVKAAKNIINAEKARLEKRVANGPPEKFSLPSIPRAEGRRESPALAAAANSGKAATHVGANAPQIGSTGAATAVGGYKTRRSRKKTKKSRKTRGRRH